MSKGPLRKPVLLESLHFCSLRGTVRYQTSECFWPFLPLCFDIRISATFLICNGLLLFCQLVSHPLTAANQPKVGDSGRRQDNVHEIQKQKLAAFWTSEAHSSFVKNAASTIVQCKPVLHILSLSLLLSTPTRSLAKQRKSLIDPNWTLVTSWRSALSRNCQLHGSPLQRYTALSHLMDSTVLRKPDKALNGT